MVTSPSVLNDLIAYLFFEKTGVECLNYYKGVPFFCKVTLQKHHEDQAFFSGLPPSLVLFRRVKQTLLLSSGLLEPIEAQVKSFDILTGMVELSRFTYVTPKIGNRREMRVETETPLEVVAQHGDRSLKGTIRDLSMSGVGVNLPAGEEWPRGTELDFLLYLPSNLLRLSGKIVRVSPTSEGIRLAINFTSNPPEKSLLMRYLFDRREQIHLEVQSMYNEALRQVKGE